ncbi:hypothetical protein [Cellulomonas telluris]|uniref:hypothetical protein n=1 Tax=Cellulomonas telluris TaxID=2306636 RepID=UPI0010A75B17|nr:hypothetical protein [Cellulomonas telluris]
MVELTLTPEARRRVIRTNVPPAVVPGLLLGLGLGGFLLLAGRTAQGLVHVLLGVVLTVLAVVLSIVRARRSRIVFGDGTYTVWSFRGDRRFTASDVAAVAMVTDMPMGAVTGHHLVLAGRSGPLVHLVGAMWDQAQLTSLAHDLASRGVPVTPFPHRITPAQLRAVDPRFVAAWRARPGVTALVAVLALLLLVALVVVVAVPLLVPA